MNKNSIKVKSLVSFIFMLVACVPSAASTVTPTPTSTSFPSPTSNEILPIITSPINLSVETPTPIETPELEWINYRLKKWTEADALSMIHTLEVYAHNNDFMGAAHSRPNLPEDYKLVELAINEMMYRFPNTRYQEVLNWRLAMANALQGETDMDDWVLNAIKIFLNQEQNTLADMNVMLLSNGYMIAEEMSAPNLFGDGNETQVYRIQPQDSFGDRGLVFAVMRQNDSYDVVEIYSDDLSGEIAADDRIVDIEDHNINGIPEVVVETVASSGSMCFSHVFIFEWRNGQFIDLTQGQIGSNECLDWSFGEPDSAGIDTISIVDFFPVFNSKYAWNGAFYELNDRQFNPSGIFLCAHYKLLLDSWGDYTRGIDALQAVLQDWPSEKVELLGTSCRDYLRFQVGLTYALHEQQSKAQTIFNDLALSPTDPQAPSVSLAAKAFLENSHSQSDLFQSCIAAQTTLDNIWTSRMDWEYTYIFEEDADLCNWQSVFPFLFYSIDPAQVSNPISMLQSASVQVRASAQIDADGDDDMDWVVAIKMRTQPVEVWALLNTGQGFQPSHIQDLYSSDDVPNQNDFKVDTYSVPGTEDVFVILSIGRRFTIFQIEQLQSGDIVRIVQSDFNVQQYKFQQTDLGLELEISYKPNDYASGRLNFYKWDEDQRCFKLLPFLENDMFGFNGPAIALPYLKRIVSSLQETDSDQGEDKPRLLYLLGLAYELAGDNSQALESYWTIWHDYPDNGYARMACSKIENCVP